MLKPYRIYQETGYGYVLIEITSKIDRNEDQVSTFWYEYNLQSYKLFRHQLEKQ